MRNEGYRERRESISEKKRMEREMSNKKERRVTIFENKKFITTCYSNYYK